MLEDEEAIPLKWEFFLKNYCDSNLNKLVTLIVSNNLGYVRITDYMKGLNGLNLEVYHFHIKKKENLRVYFLTNQDIQNSVENRGIKPSN